MCTQGRGFPTLALGLDTISITVAGAPCAVTASTYTSITCVTGALPAGYTPPAAIRGLYPGGRGVELQLFNTTAISSAAGLWQLNRTVTAASVPSTWQVVTDRFETPSLSYAFCS